MHDTAKPDLGEESPEEKAQAENNGSREHSKQSKGAPWPDAIPLELVESAADPFPIDALGEVLAGAARTIQAAQKSPDSLCAQAVLAAANLACAGHYDLIIDGRIYPLIEFFMTAAASGERKTGADKIALRPIRDHEAKLRAAYNIEKERYDRDSEEYKQASKGIRASMKKPDKPPLPPVLTIGDTTVEGVQSLYAQGLLRLGIFTTEAAGILSGWSMQDGQRLRSAAVFSSMWDGWLDPTMRAMTGLKLLHGKRTVAHFACQPNVAVGMLGASDLQGQGWLARILTAWPTSTIGDRPYTHIDPYSRAEFIMYEQAIKNLLQTALPTAEGRSDELQPKLLSLHREAKDAWVTFHDAVEGSAKRGGTLFPVQSFACKAAEHALRLAGILACVNGEREISKETIINGIELANWYLKECQRIRTICRSGECATKGLLLLDWLKKKQLKFFTKTNVTQLGPTEIRPAKLAAEAIDQLLSHHYIRPAVWERVVGFEVRDDA